MRKMLVLFVVAVVCLAGVSLAGGFTKTPSLKVKGSTTIQPLMDIFAEAYEKESGVRIDIMGGGSGVGINSVINGRADIGMSSRELKASEQGKGLVRTVIGIDVIAIIVHPGLADYVDDLDSNDIKNIFSGTVTNWKNVVEDGPDLRILPVIREAGSGTRDFFEEMSGPVPDDARYPSVTSNGAMIITVNQTRGAIGYISLGSITPECETVKFNGMDAADEGYSISRPLLLFTNGPPAGGAREFIEWILGDGQETLERMGFTRIS